MSPDEIQQAIRERKEFLLEGHVLNDGSGGLHCGWNSIGKLYYVNHARVRVLLYDKDSGRWFRRELSNAVTNYTSSYRNMRKVVLGSIPESEPSHQEFMFNLAIAGSLVAAVDNRITGATGIPDLDDLTSVERINYVMQTAQPL